MRAALITTCYREAASIEAFLEAVLAQTRPPAEIVIVDGGSEDGTVDRIRGRAEAGAPVKLIVEPGANRSVGRNRAIEATSAELIGVTDVGAVPRPDWFERIIAPLERDQSVDVVAGFYQPVAATTWEAAVAAATVPTAGEVDPNTFLPSSRSVAFRRAAWAAVGGYPERANHNEDTPFDLALRRHGACFVFEPQAVVEWRPQTSVRRLFVQFYRYARGDAQCRIWFRHYAKAYLLLTLTVCLAVGGAFWPPSLLGLPVLCLAYWGRHALRAKRRTPSAAAAALAPLANFIVDLAHAAGYTTGLLEKRLHAT